MVPLYCPNSNRVTDRDGMIQEMPVPDLLKAESGAL